VVVVNRSLRISTLDKPDGRIVWRKLDSLFDDDDRRRRRATSVRKKREEMRLPPFSQARESFTVRIEIANNERTPLLLQTLTRIHDYDVSLF